MGLARHASSTQSNKFPISEQYVKKDLRDKVDFLHRDKRQSFLIADTIVFGGHS